MLLMGKSTILINWAIFQFAMLSYLRVKIEISESNFERCHQQLLYDIPAGKLNPWIVFLEEANDRTKNDASTKKNADLPSFEVAY
jgi:hypothetical protein